MYDISISYSICMLHSSFTRSNPLIFSVQIHINSGLEISINIACGPAPVVTIYFFLYTLYLSFNALSLRLHNDIQ